MLHASLTRRLDDAYLALDAAASLKEILDSFTLIEKQISQHLLGIAEGGSNKISEHGNSLCSQYNSLSRVTKKWSVRKLFNEIEILESQLLRALAQDLDDQDNILAVLEHLDVFAEAYNTFVIHQTGVNAVPLLAAAARLRNSLEDLGRFVTHLRSNSFGGVDLQNDEAEFSLVLASVTDLVSFSEKLTALHTLYSELCYVLGVSAASHPLRVSKIESGSLWTRLFGDTRVVGLMVFLTENAVRYMHRNYTTEGKIAAIPKKVESLDAILDFSNRLKESGVDVTELQSTLAKSAITITNSLNSLVADQPVVEINGHTISVGAEMEKAALQHLTVPKISFDQIHNSHAQLSGPSDKDGKN